MRTNPNRLRNLNEAQANLIRQPAPPCTPEEQSKHNAFLKTIGNSPHLNHEQLLLLALLVHGVFKLQLYDVWLSDHFLADLLIHLWNRPKNTRINGIGIDWVLESAFANHDVVSVGMEQIARRITAEGVEYQFQFIAQHVEAFKVMMSGMALEDEEHSTPQQPDQLAA